ncbi:MAG TPA: FixH family protein [Granulicella sp.]|jgi:Cu(I)/Ag(I) efflux system membrane fusion protein/cobalt-zinc-cadmium efflux system membrane fusion protein
MNKYILRTSLFWLLIFAVVIGVVAYRSHQPPQPAAHSDGVQPIASGPSPQPTTSHMDSSMEMPAQKMEAPLVPVQLSAEQMQSIGVKTGTAEYKQLSDDIRATGTVDIDERLLSYVQVRFPGYIRKVFADATYQYVRKGEPLFTIYSPDLVATQQEYLIARQNQKFMSTSSIEGVASGAASLSSAAEQRLQQWDIPVSEITKLKETGKSIQDLTINSPVSGYITERNALPNMYAEPATRLYTVADLSRVWVNAQVFQNDIGRLKPGDIAAITVDAYPDRTFSGRIEDILPQVDMTTRTVKVRLAIGNPGIKLKPGMFVNVDLKSALGRQLVVPASAVFQTGTRQVVFIDHGNGSLEPKDVVLGPRVGDDVAILKGLEAHQQVVTSANFLLDSESQLQAAAGSYTPPPSSNTTQQASAVNVDFTTDPNPPHKGSNTFRVKLTDANGSPISGADVSVTFFMPSMPAMGMAAMNATTKLPQKSAGLYEGQGNLDTGGTWQVTVTVQQNGRTLATKLLHMNTEGGM